MRTTVKSLLALGLSAMICLTHRGQVFPACSFVYQFDAGSGAPSSSRFKSQILLTSIAGRSSGGSVINVQGYLPVANSNYTNCFLVSDHPLAVRVAPGSPSGTCLTKSSDQTMNLAWTDGANGVPVQYRVYFGDDPLSLPMANTVSPTTFPTQNLSYGKNYYWKIDTVDLYGRDTWSAGTFSFSIVPGIDHMYCAPNPFKAGSQTTTFIFNMPGPGSGRMRIYTLPHADLVFEQSLDNLAAGTNLWAYNGLDGSGRPLYNGVYIAVLELHGSQGDDKQKFKFLVVK
jgi:hypothetical protein